VNYKLCTNDVLLLLLLLFPVKRREMLNTFCWRLFAVNSLLHVELTELHAVQ
jgi:hypothetical protein